MAFLLHKARPDPARAMFSALANWNLGDLTNYNIDTSGNGRDLTITSASGIRKRTPGIGVKTSTLSAANGNVDLRLTRNDSALYLLGAMTLECTYCNAGTSQQTIARFGIDANNKPYAQQITSNRLVWTQQNGALSSSSTSTTGAHTAESPFADFAHFVVTRASNGQTVKQYVNGNLFMSSTLVAPTGGSSADPFQVGMSAAAATTHGGAYTQLAVYGAELTASQVMTLCRVRYGGLR